jgi:hypothetical protein
MRPALAGLMAALCTCAIALVGAAAPVLNAQADAPPSVSITAPAPGTVSGDVSIAVSATDDVGISKVRFWAGSTYLGYDLAAPFSKTWATFPGKNGFHVIRAQAFDTANQSTSAQITVTVINPDNSRPEVTITSPQNNGGAVGMITISANAYDWEGVQKVQFWAGNNYTYLGYDTSAPYSKSWDSTTVPDGPHILRARVVDWGNRTWEHSITVIVANNDVTPPTVTIASPAAGAKVLGFVPIEAVPTDERGVQKVQFWVDNTYLGFDASPPYSKEWDSTVIRNVAGPHTIRVRAVDWAGNVSPSVTSGVTTFLTAMDAPAPTLEGGYGAALGRGDVNNDGADDVMVGAIVEQRVYIYSGVDRSLLRVLESPNPSEFPDTTNFGSSIASADMDGDGYDDVIVGAPLEDPDGTPPPVGRAHVFSGEDGSLMHTFASPSPVGYFGVSVAAGDVNGDSHADAIIGAYEDGKVYVFSGADGALLYSVHVPSVALGIRVASGDVNNDGNDDIVALAYRADNGKGRAYVYSGSTGQQMYSLPSPSQQGSGATQMEAALGDVDADGFADILISYPAEQVGEYGQSGRIYMYSGATGEVIDTLENPEPGTYVWFGNSITIGDGKVFAGSYRPHPNDLIDGAVWMFDFDGTASGVVRSPAPPNTQTIFGGDTAVVGTRLFVGAPRYTGPGPSMRGRLYLTAIADIPAVP